MLAGLHWRGAGPLTCLQSVVSLAIWSTVFPSDSRNHVANLRMAKGR